MWLDLHTRISQQPPQSPGKTLEVHRLPSFGLGFVYERIECCPEVLDRPASRFFRLDWSSWPLSRPDSLVDGLHTADYIVGHLQDLLSLAFLTVRNRNVSILKMPRTKQLWPFARGGLSLYAASGRDGSSVEGPGTQGSSSAAGRVFTLPSCLVAEVSTAAASASSMDSVSRSRLLA